jgi:hypothetical protein
MDVSNECAIEIGNSKKLKVMLKTDYLTAIE